MSDIDDELERLRARRVELTRKLDFAEFVDEKEEYTKELEAIQKQIDILERMTNR